MLLRNIGLSLTYMLLKFRLPYISFVLCFGKVSSSKVASFSVQTEIVCVAMCRLNGRDVTAWFTVTKFLCPVYLQVH